MDTGLDLEIWGKSKKSKTYEKALDFTVHTDLTDIDLHIQDLVVYIHLGPATVKDSFLTETNIGQVARDNWN